MDDNADFNYIIGKYPSEDLRQVLFYCNQQLHIASLILGVFKRSAIYTFQTYNHIKKVNNVLRNSSETDRLQGWKIIGVAG